MCVGERDFTCLNSTNKCIYREHYGLPSRSLKSMYGKDIISLGAGKGEKGI